MPRIAVLHTSPVTVEILRPLLLEAMPDAEIVNTVDESLLAQLLQNGGDASALQSQVIRHATDAEQAGADVILSACSTLGPLASVLRDTVSIPVVRIDDAMAEEAVRRGTRVGVAATIWTTMQPTTALLRQKAVDAGREMVITSRLVDSAFQRLAEGDSAGHDALLVAALVELAREVDVVVLAQASMSRVLPKLPPEIQGKFLTSPRLSVSRVKAALESITP